MSRLAPKADARQPDLFGPDPAWPQGLRYQPAFVTAEEEQSLIAGIAALPLAPFQFGAFEGKRRVASYGWRYDFGDHRLHAAEPVPDFIRPFAARAEAFAAVPPGAIRHVLLTEYATGAGIGWHRDKDAFGIVLGISLGSACPFRFRRKAGDRWQRHTLQAEARSLYLMSGEARSIWEHGIAPVETPRWSVTLRTMAR